MGRNYYERQDLNIAASSQVNYGRGGDWLYYDYGGRCQIQFDKNGKWLDVRRGWLLKHDFRSFEVKNLSTSLALVSSVIVGNGEPPDFPDLSEQIQFNASIPDIVCGPGALTQIFVKTPYVVGLWVNTPAGSQPVRIGGMNIGAASGNWLNPGLAPLRIPHGHETFVYNPSGVAVTVGLSGEYI